ncbi:MAG: nucleotidyltransferase domain-containing protein [Candidatus Cloacimonetes bacterium]|nr:nucleotidyltransferase domain-containing protein [Candidatus Cloacimonadota bacterium]MBL7086755.1 nucleotidyltransferase domain-containing protein [Candidatus Cloacimonadota bacterium]
MDKRSLEIARQLKKDIEKNLSKGSTSGGNVIDMRIFGSRARDDFEKDSDLDIFIELEKNNPEIRKIIGHLTWKFGFENGFVITTIIFTRDELENGPMKYSPIYRSIERDGIEV